MGTITVLRRKFSHIFTRSIDIEYVGGGTKIIDAEDFASKVRSDSGEPWSFENFEGTTDVFNPLMNMKLNRRRLPHRYPGWKPSHKPTTSPVAATELTCPAQSC